MYGNQTPGIQLTTVQEDFDYILQVVKNTNKQYKIIKKKI